MFFQVLQANGLTINPSKFTFTVTLVKFWGNKADEIGILPLHCHVQTVQEFSPAGHANMVAEVMLQPHWPIRLCQPP
jgi:hypothetical protein